MNDLRWVRVFTPCHIPKYLVEQIKHKDFTVDDFYKFQEINCLIKTEKGEILNPLFHLYVLVNKENITKGFLWFVIDALTKDLIVQNYSVDKEYWGGEAVEKLASHVKEICKKGNLKKIYWVTRYPLHSMRHGFSRSKNILMEYDPVHEEKEEMDISKKEDEKIDQQEQCKN